MPLTRTTSRAASVHESMYSNRVSFIRRAARKVGFGGNVKMSGKSPHFGSPLSGQDAYDGLVGDELRRFSSMQAQQTGLTLARNPSRTQ